MTLQKKVIATTNSEVIGEKKKATRRKRVKIETSDVEIAPKTIVDIASTIDEIDRADLAQVVDDDMSSPTVQEYTRDLAFQHDIVTFSIGETDDPNAENPVNCGVNGETRSFMRGVEYKVARKFVESIIKTVDRIQTEQYKDSDGCDQTRIKRLPASKYPIAIINDPAGETGRRWFLHQSKNSW